MSATATDAFGPGKRRLFAGSLLVMFSTAILRYLWAGRFDYFHTYFLWGTYVSVVLVVVLGHSQFRDTRRRMGLRWDNFADAAHSFGGFTLAAGAILCVAGLVEGSSFQWVSIRKLLIYSCWALLQQHLLQNFLRLRAEDLFTGSRFKGRDFWTLLLPAALFSLFHLPNLFLMVFTFAGALFWCRLFRKTPNLFWAAFSHVVLAVVLFGFFRASLLDQFGVGKQGFRYDYYGGGVRVAGGRDGSGHPFVATLPGPDRHVRSRVKVFEPDGQLRATWVAFEWLDFSGELAVGDLGFGPGDEIVVVPGPRAGNPPLVRVFEPSGKKLAEFSVNRLKSGYGLWVSVACRRVYVCPGPGPDAESRILEFGPEGEFQKEWRVDNPDLHNGVRATALCRPGAPPDPILFWPTDIAVNPSTLFFLDRSRGSVVRTLNSLDLTFGLQAAVAHFGGKPAIAVAPGPLKGYPALIHVLDLAGNKLGDFAAGNKDEVSCGATLGAVDVDGDGSDEIIVGEGSCPGSSTTVRVFRVDGTRLQEWSAY